MLNYNVLYNWIVALGFPESYDQYVTFLAGDTTQYDELAKNYSDATLEILDSNNNVVRTITFYDAFPTTLDSITFASTNEGVNYVVGSATFRFGHFKFT
jgi:flagellar hook assembly protein FlgD